MGPDPTQPEHTFDPQYIRGQPNFDLGNFCPDQRDFFESPKRKIEEFGIFRGNFPNPDPTRATKN